MSFMRHILACNNFVDQDYLVWTIFGQQVGYIRQSFAQHLKQWPDFFSVSALEVVFIAKQNEPKTNSDIFLGVLQSLVDQGVIGYLHGEQYVVTPDTRENGLFQIDRAVAAYFGVKAFGQHLNAVLKRADGDYMWISQRAQDRMIYPGMLDNLAAGGLPDGIGLAENLAKECFEEAGINASLAKQAKPVSAITYNAESERGYKPDTLYCYDLVVPESFQPVCTDGEVEGFYLMPIEEVIARVYDTEDFKPNCNLVIIDFLLRHGYIDPNDKGYLALVQGLHSTFYY